MSHQKNAALVFLLLTLSFSSKAVRTVLCGHFKYKAGKTISVLYYANPIDYIEETYTKLEADVDDHNNFKIELNIDKPTMLNAMNGEAWLFVNKFIYPGDSLMFDLDSTNTGIDGIGENGMAAMLAYDATIATPEKISEMQVASATKTDVEFASYEADLADSSIAFYDRYFAGHEVPAQYAAAVNAEVRYDAMVNLVQFGWRGKNGNPGIFNNPGYMHYFSRNKYNDSSALVSNHYVFFIGEFTKYLLEPTAGRTGKMYEYYEGLRLRDSIARHYFTGQVYDIALYQILYSAIDHLNQKKGSTAFDAAYIKTTKCITELGKNFHDKHLLTRLKEKLKYAREDGKPAYDFAATQPDGKIVHLSDFKGKVVYIDFWATNCVACVQELPHIKRLQEKYKGQDIVFLYFSFDQSRETLDHFITAKQLSGTHVIDEKGFASQVATRYHIGGLPRYIIVDRKGTIVTCDAPRPGNGPEQILNEGLAQKQE